MSSAGTIQSERQTSHCAQCCPGGQRFAAQVRYCRRLDDVKRRLIDHSSQGVNLNGRNTRHSQYSVPESIQQDAGGLQVSRLRPLVCKTIHVSTWTQLIARLFIARAGMVSKDTTEQGQVERSTEKVIFGRLQGNSKVLARRKRDEKP